MSGSRIETARRLARLGRKELRETLRDRRTTITLVLMPLLLYPLLGLAMQKFLLASFRPASEPLYLVAVRSDEARRVVSEYLIAGEQMLVADAPAIDREWPRQSGRDVDDRADAAPPDETTAASRLDAQMSFVVVSDPDAAVEESDADLAIHVSGRPSAVQNGRPPRPVHFELTYRENSPVGRQAADFIERRLQAVNNDFRQQQLERLGASRSDVPVRATRTRLDGAGRPIPVSLAALVPLVLILMTITGAVYPAIDLTAGERERGTLEMLVAAPVPRLGLLLAKYAAVLVVAVLTATINLVAMTVTTLSIGLGPLLFGAGGLSGWIVVQVFGLLILFAAFFSAVLLALTSMARSFKEAQAYLIPLMLVALAPGVLSMIPDLKLAGILAVVPLANIVLLARDLFERSADPVTAAVVVVSTLLYALAAIVTAARIFGTDAVLYGAGGSWSDLLRRPRIETREATVSSAMLCLALLLPGSFLLGNSIARLQGLPLAARLALNGLATMVLFGGLPLAAALLRRVRIVEGFRLRAASPTAFAGAALLGVSLWPFAYEAVIVMHELGVTFPNTDLLEMTKELTEELRALSPAAVLLALAVVPAVFEEFFFRGYLFSALRARTGPAATIVVSAVLFGLFHVVVRDALAVERLLPSTLLGLALGWICYRTGSVLPGIVLHGCHNGLLLGVMLYQEQLASWTRQFDDQSHLPALWLACAAVVAAAGFGLVQAGRREA